MAKLHWPRSVHQDGWSNGITVSDAAWKYISFKSRRIGSGEVIHSGGPGLETAVIVLSGTARATVGNERFTGLGSRASVFEPVGPDTLLVEAGKSVEIMGEVGAEVVVASAPAEAHLPTRVIESAFVKIESRGEGSTGRVIRQVLPPSDPAARLILVEVITPGGHWSSYPPHKHDVEQPPVESYLEELYFYRFERPEGYAYQRVYTADRSLDELIVARDGDIVIVQRGYHPVVAAPGGDCYYLNVMAGPTRLWNFTLDPDHAWLAPQVPMAGAPSRRRRS